jgi:hypothetical protein
VFVLFVNVLVLSIENKRHKNRILTNETKVSDYLCCAKF